MASRGGREAPEPRSEDTTPLHRTAPTIDRGIWVRRGAESLSKGQVAPARGCQLRPPRTEVAG